MGREASNNNHDMIFIIKLTALLQKVKYLKPEAITAEEVLKLATIDGAKCLGLDNIIGSIEIGKKADIVFEPTHPADIFATWADIDKARKILGWQPSTSFDSGIENVVNWYNSQRSWASTIELGN